MRPARTAGTPPADLGGLAPSAAQGAAQSVDQPPLGGVDDLVRNLR